MAQSAWTDPVIPHSRLNARLGRNASPMHSRPTVSQETECGVAHQGSMAERPPTAHAIIPEDPLVPDPDDEIIDDPGWEDDEIIRDPDPLEPPVVEPPPGWDA